MLFSARFTPASGSAVDLSLDDTTPLPVEPYYNAALGIAECKIRCMFFPSPTLGVATADTAAQTRLLVHTHLEAIRTNCKFAPPIRKPMARGHTVLFSPHNNAGPLVFRSGSTDRTVFSSCWLDRIEIVDDGLPNGIVYDLTFVAEKDPTSYL